MSNFVTEIKWFEIELKYHYFADMEEDYYIDNIDQHATVGDFKMAGGIVLLDAKNEIIVNKY